MTRFFSPAMVLTAAAVLIFSGPESRADTPIPTLQETPFWDVEVRNEILPPIAARIPSEPLVVDLEDKGRRLGRHGGNLRTLVTRSKDIRQMVVYGYARLMGFNQDYDLVPDILRDVTVEDGRRFTLHLRAGMRWSDGEPFTAEAFRYFWEDIALNPELSPSGPPSFLKLGQEWPTVSFPDPLTVVYEWSSPNPGFLPNLAQARPPFIYRPGHYLSQFHAKYADPDKLAERVAKKKVRGWAALHNKRDNMYKFDNPSLPTLQPWIPADVGGETRRVFVRNPYYHRIDTRGRQLPYIDTVEMTIVGSGLVAAKSNAGEVDLQARGLSFKDVSILKKGENEGAGYRVFLWPNGTASQIAIYPNLNALDDNWRALLRDVRFRRALSLGIDRRIINRALYFGLGKEGNMTALSVSPFYSRDNLTTYSEYNPEKANAILDEMGLTTRRADGLRLLPDGRPMRLVVETAGERQEVEDALQIIADTWYELGIQMVMRPLDRDILRNHVFAGTAEAAVWFGWDNGIPTADTSPAYLAPRMQEFFAWPKWGQYYQTGGEAGQEVDMPKPARLMLLASEWERSTTREERTRIWEEMLQIHAEEMYAIGILSEAPQPVVVAETLENVPTVGLWAWEPGSHFGIHRMDEFWFNNLPPS
ncbi:MAG: ABC transporter substrate-binding protein [Pseudomonadota bacterium]